MRIIIDTELQAVIVPDSYRLQVDRLNEVITQQGGRPLDCTEYVRTCFNKAYAERIICQSELAALRAEKRGKTR